MYGNARFCETSQGKKGCLLVFLPAGRAPCIVGELGRARRIPCGSFTIARHHISSVNSIFHTTPWSVLRLASGTEIFRATSSFPGQLEEPMSMFDRDAS